MEAPPRTHGLASSSLNRTGGSLTPSVTPNHQLVAPQPNQMVRLSRPAASSSVLTPSLKLMTLIKSSLRPAACARDGSEALASEQTSPPPPHVTAAAGDKGMVFNGGERRGPRPQVDHTTRDSDGRCLGRATMEGTKGVAARGESRIRECFEQDLLEGSGGARAG